MARRSLRAFFPGRSAALRSMLEIATRVAAHDTSVLLTGETGTGKDRMAEALHAAGERRDHPFVRIDCAAIPSELFEAELFGHEKGAFTDARERRPGVLERARGGTVYLDDLASLEPGVQAKLLRVLQQRTIVRLGGTREIPIDVRVVASSSVPRDELGQRVRADLLYRIDVVTIEMPPLRERREDIPVLARRFHREIDPKGTITAEAMKRLVAWHWPGNVRELRNAIESAGIRGDSGRIDERSLPESMSAPPVVLENALSGGWSLERLEREYIARTLERAGGNFTRAAAMLGIHRKTLLDKRRRYGLDGGGGEETP